MMATTTNASSNENPPCRACFLQFMRDSVIPKTSIPAWEGATEEPWHRTV
jgi:hypothetical protein